MLLLVVLLSTTGASAQVPAHRQGTLRVQTEPGATVSTEQMRHAFEFGTAISADFWGPAGRKDANTREKYREILAENFNAAVHENAAKWYTTEKDTPGLLDYRQIDHTLGWLAEHDFSVRGHCLFWADPTRVQVWVKGLDEVQLRSAVGRRAREITARYADVIGEWDVNNEMTSHRFYRDRLGDDAFAFLCAQARAGDAEVILYVNDYGVLNPTPWADHFEQYVADIEGWLAAGVPIGGIGVQGHFFHDIDLVLARQRLDRLAQLGLPIKITEFDLAGDLTEEQRAEKLAGFYALCFENPAVEGIYMWGFWQGKHWREDAGLWAEDWTPLPAALAYRQLIYEQWWSRTEGAANDAGVYEANVTLGTHRVRIGAKSMLVRVTPDGTELIESTD